MNQILDFTDCKRVFRSLGGTDRKFEVEYNGKAYMLKFSENHAKRTDISTSSVNNVVSEYISSHIAAAAGLPVHNTLLGVYRDEVVVACEDFRQPDEENMEFREFVRAVFEPKDVKRVIRLDQIYAILADRNIFSEALEKQSIKRYWDTFVVDAFVGNFDRHIGNWGYIVKNNQMSLAPVYDFGSTLLPQLSDDGMESIMGNSFEMYKRCLVFPSAALFITSEKAGKVGYYDMMASDYDENCSKAVFHMVPGIRMDEVKHIVDSTPFISDTRKEFYKKYLQLRKELILDRAYICCANCWFDSEALKRLQQGIQYSDELLRKDLAAGKIKPKGYSL